MENKKRIAIVYLMLLISSCIQQQSSKMKEFYTTQFQHDTMDKPNHHLKDKNIFPLIQSTVTPNKPKEHQTEKWGSITESEQTTKISNDGHFWSDICNHYGSCNYQSMIGENFRYCNCDDVCFKYNDCCFDANVTSIDVNGPYECVSPKTPSEQIYGYFIVRKCPFHNNSSEIYYLCKSTNVISTGPWVISKENVIYQNKFCAKCNGIDTFTQFAINVSNINSEKFYRITDEISFINVINNSAKARIEMVPSANVSIRRCLIYQLPNSENADKCNNNSISAIQILSGKQSFDRNVFCNPNNQYKKCFDPLGYHLVAIKDFDLYPMSVIFSFDNERQCEGHAQIKPNEKSSFHAGVTKISGKCQNTPLITGYQFTEQYNFYLNKPITLDVGETIAILLAYSLSDFIQIESVDKISLYKTWTVDNTQFNLRISIRGKITVLLEMTEMKSLAQRLSNLKWIVRIRKLNKLIFEINNFEDNPIIYAEDLKWKNEIFPFSYHMVDKGIIPKLGSTTLQNFRCQQQQLECSLLGESFDTNLTIDSVKCLKFAGIEKSRSVLSTVKIVLTYTGMSVSVVALGVSIAVYRVTNMYTSIPGSIVQSLFISLFVSNILFMAGIGATDNQRVCYCIGVGLHYFWLLVFAFKSVALVHMTHMIRTMMNNSAHMTSQKTHTKQKLNILSLILPLIFVVPGIVFDKFKFYNVRVKYNNKVCFPTGFPGNIIFVSVPIGMSILTNMLCLGIVAVVITRQSMETRLVRKSNSFRFVSVYVRISVVTGMFWISGILGSLFNDVVTEFMFITLCSFQGLFVSLAYVSSQKVVNRIREKISSKATVTSTEKF